MSDDLTIIFIVLALAALAAGLGFVCLHIGKMQRQARGRSMWRVVVFSGHYLKQDGDAWQLVENRDDASLFPYVQATAYADALRIMNYQPLVVTGG